MITFVITASGLKYVGVAYLEAELVAAMGEAFSAFEVARPGGLHHVQRQHDVLREVLEIART